MRINAFKLKAIAAALFIFLTTVQSVSSADVLLCVRFYTKLPSGNLFKIKPIGGGQFLHQSNPQLHTSVAIERTAAQLKRRGYPTLTKPSDKIEKWINYLNYITLESQNNPSVLNRVKKYYLNQYVIQEKDVPVEFADLQVKIYREAHPKETMTHALKAKLVEVAIDDQRASLERWLDFLFSSNAREFPMWVKYWSFKSLTNLGKFDKGKTSFKSRNKNSMAAFPELNEEAYSKMVDLIVKRNSGAEFTDADPQLISILKSGSFSKLYGYTLNSVTSPTNGFSSSEGAWRRYPRGSDISEFVKDLDGKNSGWCSAGKGSAFVHLAGGDFHIYYSNDKDGQPTIPRIAIRMLGSRIWEVRGVANNQHLDPVIAATDILPMKLQEFGYEGMKYSEQLESLNKFNEIEKRVKDDAELTLDELKFLYQIEKPINKFGNRTDNRIKELIRARDQKRDISQLLATDLSDITFHRLTKNAWRWKSLKIGSKTHVYLYNSLF